MSSCNIAIIGAGKTGRGFIGRLLQEGRNPFVLIDKNRELIYDLNKEEKFQVGFFGDARSPVQVKDFLALHTEDEQVQEVLKSVRLVFVSVGGGNIKAAAEWMAGAMLKRLEISDDECSVILCENANKPANKFREFLLSALPEENRSKASRLFGFSESTIFCTTIEDSGTLLDIMSEDYPMLQCDAVPLKKNLPEIQGLKPVEGFENFLVRKLYTYNAASAVISYIGWWKGYKMYSDAANDKEIADLMAKMYDEVGNALCREYGYEKEDQREFAALSLRKFQNRTIVDTIERNAREPHRKLGNNERIIGPVSLIEKYGGDSYPLLLTAAAALLYEEQPDSEWSKLKDTLGAEGILEQICKLDKNSVIAEKILRYRQNLIELGRGKIL